jgi:DNA-binding transcriptional ArsR family regulator
VQRFEDKLSQVFKALADPGRRQLLELLAAGERSISELAEPTGMSLPSVLKHLKVLADAGLIDQQKTGRVRHCRLEDGPLVEATVWMSRQSKYWQNQFETLAAFLAPPDKPGE